MFIYIITFSLNFQNDAYAYVIYCSFIFPKTDTIINRHRKMLFGFLQGMRKLSKIVDQGVSSLIFTLNTLPAGCVFFAVAGILLFFFGCALFFFVAVVGLLILKVLFKPPMPVATGFLEAGAVFFFALQLTLRRRQVVTDDGTGANAKVFCTISTTSAMTKMALLLLNNDDDIIRLVVCYYQL